MSRLFGERLVVWRFLEEVGNGSFKHRCETSLRSSPSVENRSATFGDLRLGPRVGSGGTGLLANPTSPRERRVSRAPLSRGGRPVSHRSFRFSGSAAGTLRVARLSFPLRGGSRPPRGSPGDAAPTHGTRAKDARLRRRQSRSRCAGRVRNAVSQSSAFSRSSSTDAGRCDEVGTRNRDTNLCGGAAFPTREAE
jgi:hypothetical protein